MFTAAGTFMCNIDDVKFAEPKFAKGPNDFDICIHIVATDGSGQSDWWHGEMSENYGRGNFKDMMQKDITMMTLRKAGFEGDDLSTLQEQLMGKQVPATVAASESQGKTYYNVKYIGESGGAIKELAPDAFKAKVAALFGNRAAGATAAPAAAAPGATQGTATTPPKTAPALPKPNPFAAKPAAGAAMSKSPF
jgi:hypothetical protein